MTSEPVASVAAPSLHTRVDPVGDSNTVTVVLGPTPSEIVTGPPLAQTVGAVNVKVNDWAGVGTAGASADTLPIEAASAIEEARAKIAGPPTERRGTTVQVVDPDKPSETATQESVVVVGTSKTVTLTLAPRPFETDTRPVACPTKAVTLKEREAPHAGTTAERDIREEGEVLGKKLDAKDVTDTPPTLGKMVHVMIAPTATVPALPPPLHDRVLVESGRATR
jgi:hypothetical protein